MCCKKFVSPLGSKPDCFSNEASCIEQGRTFSIKKKKGNTESFCKIKVDGCLIRNQTCCDYIFIRCKNPDFYFVELKKGSDVTRHLSKSSRQSNFSTQRCGSLKIPFMDLLPANPFQVLFETTGEIKKLNSSATMESVLTIKQKLSFKALRISIVLLLLFSSPQ